MVRLGRSVPYATLAGMSSPPNAPSAVASAGVPAAEGPAPDREGAAPPRLTEASYMVLGLVELAGQATPYDLKRVAQMSTNYFWSIPHTQLYSECARLAGEGLLDES